jgi:hypothetical protein
VELGKLAFHTAVFEEVIVQTRELFPFCTICDGLVHDFPIEGVDAASTKGVNEVRVTTEMAMMADIFRTQQLFSINL